MFFSKYVKQSSNDLNTQKFLSENLPEKFSFEKDYLENYMQGRMYGVIQDEYFIDIGIPEDYFRAQQELKIFA